MMCRRAHCVGVVLLLVALGGCGFQLRGSAGKLAPDLSPVYLQGPDLYGPFMSQVRSGLRAASAVLADQAQQARTILQVFSADYRRRQLSVSGTGSVREDQLTFIVEFEVRTPKGTVVRPRQRIMVQRDYTYSVTAALSLSDEESLLQRDMYRDAAQQLLWRLELG